MDLKSFVSQSLIQILDGIHEAQKHAKGIEAQVNPGIIMGHGMSGFTPVSFDHKVHPVEFDVAVEVREENKQGLEGKITVVGVGIGGGGEKQTMNSATSRIKFRVFIAPKTQ